MLSYYQLFSDIEGVCPITGQIGISSDDSASLITTFPSNGKYWRIHGGPMKFMHLHLVTPAVVVNIPSCGKYVFAENGNPEKKILCHRNQGGLPVVNDRGTVTLDDLGNIEMPQKGAEIVLVRESANPATPGYTRALGWALKADWNEVAWVANAKETYKAVAYNHRSNGKSQSNTDKEVLVAQDTLLHIVRDYPRRPSYPDPLGEHYSTELKGTTLSYNTVWYHRETNNSWTECADPRPIVE